MKTLSTSKQEGVLELKVGIMYSRDFCDNSEKLVFGAVHKLKALDVKEENIYVESICCLSQLPLATKRFIEILRSRAIFLQVIIVIGVVKNNIIHSVQSSQGESVIDALQRLQYLINIPIVTGIIDRFDREEDMPSSAAACSSTTIGEMWAEAAIEMVDKFYTC